MSVFLNLISLPAHCYFLALSLIYQDSVSSHISLVHHTGSLLVDGVAAVSCVESLLAFSSLFAGTWRWKSVFWVRGAVILCASLLLTSSLLDPMPDPLHPNDPYERLEKAMGRYSQDVTSKMSIDHLQLQLECCGSRNYTDWYRIPWSEGKATAGSILATQDASNDISKDTFFTDNVPFSCCSHSSVLPCIHFGVETPHPVFNYTPGQDLTLWRQGCGKILTDKAQWLQGQMNGILTCVLIMQILQFITSLSQYSNHKKSMQLIEIANENMNDKEDNEQTSVAIDVSPKLADRQTSLESIRNNENNVIKEFKPEAANVKKPVDKKGVKFNEKDNAFYDNANPWDKIPQYPLNSQQKALPKSDVLTKSILKRQRNVTPVNEVDVKDKTPDVDQDLNLTETFREFRNTVVRNIRNRHEMYKAKNNFKAAHFQNTPVTQTSDYQRPLRYLSSKLRKVRRSSQSNKAVGQTWSQLIGSHLARFRAKYSALESSEDETVPERVLEEAVPERVFMHRRGEANGRGKYFSTSDSDADSPRHRGENRDKSDEAAAKNINQFKQPFSKVVYFDHSPRPLLKQKHHPKDVLETFGSSTFSASTTGDELVRKYWQEIVRENNTSSIPQRGTKVRPKTQMGNMRGRYRTIDEKPVKFLHRSPMMSDSSSNSSLSI